MRRVLFVDDEPAVLDGIRRNVQRNEAEWEVSFAPSAENALTLMEASPFDVIVSDLQMPGRMARRCARPFVTNIPRSCELCCRGVSEMGDVLRPWRIIARTGFRTTCWMRSGLYIANYLAHEHPVHPPVFPGMAQQPPDPAYLKTVGADGSMEEWGEMAEAVANEMRGATSVRS
jgi:hypothetical protein